MLSVEAAHARLVAADPGLPGLAALLDPEPVAQRLGVPVRRRYLRYKPGAGVLALLDVDGAPAIGHAWAETKGAKRAKALRHAGDDVLLDDPISGLLVVAARADRRLPALRTHVLGGRLRRTLDRSLREPVELEEPVTLSHKPGRRWVGLVHTASGDPVTLRVYPTGDLAERAAAHELALRPGSQVRLPRLLAEHEKGVLALEHLPGRILHDGVDEAGLARLGEVLGDFHAERVVGGPRQSRWRPDGPVAGEVLPEVFEGFTAVATAAGAALRPAPGTVVHGDFSLDQVVEDDGQLGFIDLDRVRVGEPVEDLAGVLAHSALDVLHAGGGVEEALSEAARIRGPLLAGHSGTGPGAPPGDLDARVALALLGRAEEPFRGGEEDWVRVTHDLVATAAALLPVGVSA